MEGLIPMVYRTIKKNRTRSRYQHLSSSFPSPAAANASAQTYNIADFYPNDEYVFSKNGQYAHGDDDVGGFNANINKVHHRRYKSFHLDNSGRGGFGFSPPLYHDAAARQQSKKLVRFRSHRFFSCVTGAP